MESNMEITHLEAMEIVGLAEGTYTYEQHVLQLLAA